METGCLNLKVRALYEEYAEAVETGELDKAIEAGIKILEELLEVAKKNVLSAMTTPALREIALNILAHYEQELSYVKGAREAAQSMPAIYAVGVEEKALEVLSRSVNGLFNFVLGALLAIADISSCLNSVS